MKKKKISQDDKIEGENVQDNNSTEEQNKEQNLNNEELLTKLKQLEEQLNEKNSQFMRLAADFDNFRKRNEKEKEEFIKIANEKLIVSLLPVIDNLERAIKSSENNQDINAILNGLNLTYRQLIEALQKVGLESIEALGKEFDPNLHDAVQREINEQYEQQTVVEEYQKGYILNGKVIRHSMVKVAMKE